MIALLPLFLFVVIAVVVVVVISVIYNRRLDRIARGEERERHSNIPDPGTSLSVIYQFALLVVVVITLFALLRRTASLEAQVDNLQNNLCYVEGMVGNIQDLLERKDSIVGGVCYEVMNIDFEKRIAEVDYSVELIEYSEGTKVRLSLDGREYDLPKKANGDYGAVVQADLFAYHGGAKLSIEANGETIVERADFPEEIFWDVLPMPGWSCVISHSEFFGRINKVEGDYIVTIEDADQIENVTITYISDGKDYKTLDITEAVLAQSPVELNEKPNCKSDFGYRMMIQTKYGLTIQHSGVFVGKNTNGSESIIDENGNVLWANTY